MTLVEVEPKIFRVVHDYFDVPGKGKVAECIGPKAERGPTLLKVNSPPVELKAAVALNKPVGRMNVGS